MSEVVYPAEGLGVDANGLGQRFEGGLEFYTYRNGRRHLYGVEKKDDGTFKRVHIQNHLTEYTDLWAEDKGAVTYLTPEDYENWWASRNAQINDIYPEENSYYETQTRRRFSRKLGLTAIAGLYYSGITNYMTGRYVDYEEQGPTRRSRLVKRAIGAATLLATGAVAGYLINKGQDVNQTQLPQEVQYYNPGQGGGAVAVELPSDLSLQGEPGSYSLVNDSGTVIDDKVEWNRQGGLSESTKADLKESGYELKQKTHQYVNASGQQKTNFMTEVEKYKKNGKWFGIF